jgi:hypothetical protein
MIIYVFKKHEKFFKTMKIVEFFLIIWGKLSELEPDKNGPVPQHCIYGLHKWSQDRDSSTGTGYRRGWAKRIIFPIITGLCW